MDINAVNHGKLGALWEFCYCAAQEGGFTGIRPNDKDIIDWATAFMPCMFKVISGCTPYIGPSSDVFEEMDGLLQEVRMKPSTKKLNWNKASSGDVAEAVKFLMVMAYEILLVKPLVLTKICMQLKLMSQMQMAHIMVAMDEDDESNSADKNKWWEVMYEQFDDSALKHPTAQICYTAKTPLQRSGGSAVYEPSNSPVCMVAVQSPNRRERDLEKKYNTEKETNNMLRGDFEELRRKMATYETQLEELKTKNAELETKAPKCGLDCTSATEAAKLNIRINILNNRIEGLEADNHALRESDNKLAGLISERNAFAAKAAELDAMVNEFEKRNAKLFKDYTELQTKYNALEMEQPTSIVQAAATGSVWEDEYRSAVEDKGKSDQENNRIKKQMASLRKQIDLLEKKNGELMEKLAEGQGNPAEVRSIKIELETALFNLKASNVKVTDLTKSVSRLEGENDALIAKVQELQDQLRKAPNGYHRQRNQVLTPMGVDHVRAREMEKPHLFNKLLPGSENIEPVETEKVVLNPVILNETPIKQENPIHLPGHTMEELKERNRRQLPHNRCHYIFDSIDGDFSPSNVQKGLDPTSYTPRRVASERTIIRR